MGKPLLTFLRYEKNVSIMEKDALNIPCFGCTVERFVLICFTAFGNLDFLDLLCGPFLMSSKRNATLELLIKN